MSNAVRKSTLFATLRHLVVRNPLIPLSLLLLALIIILEIMQPGIVSARWLGNTVKFAAPLAMMAACQTLAMLTGGIDLSVGTIGTIAGFLTATLSPLIGIPGAVALALLCSVLAGSLNGIGIAFFRVHPLIMTLGTGLIGTGCLLVYQRHVIATGTIIPDFLVWLGTGRTGYIPNVLAVLVPFTFLIIWAQRHTGFGRLLYAIGANEAAARLSGVRVWQVHLALYSLSGAIAGLTGLLYLGLVKTPSLSLAVPLDLPSVAAAVIGGTSIFGGRGGFGGTILGALILTVLSTMLTLLDMPEGMRRIIYGLIILSVTALSVRLTEKG